MKRLSCFVLAAIAVALLSGCSTKPLEQTEDVDPIIVTYQTMSTSRLSGLARIEAAVNEIAREEAGVEISFRTIDAYDSFATYPLWLSQGECIDLMVLNYQDIQGYIKGGQLLPLDELLDQYGSGIQAIIDSNVDIASGTTMDGKIYGLTVPTKGFGSGTGGGLWISRHYLEEADFPYEEEKIYSLDEISILLARLKELYPDKYPLGQVTSGNTFSTHNFFYGMLNPFGSGGTSGILDEETGRIINFYETEAYYDFLQRMRDWYQRGYIYPDAAYTGFSNLELMRSGEVLCIPHVSAPGIVTAEGVGEEVVCLRLSEIVNAGDSSGSRGIFWVIPATCQYPEQAMAFLNLMYTDSRVVNLLAWGEEGKDYRFLDEAEGVIAHPEGVTSEDADYFNPLGLYGDMRLAYSMGSNELNKQLEEYAKSTKHIGEEYEGFLFDETPVTMEAWQVQQVLERYLPVLECGCVDLEENYATFLSALKDAGIETVIAEKQRQLDAWLAEQ